MNKERLRKMFPIWLLIIFLTLFIYIGYIYNEYIVDIYSINTRSQNLDELEWIFIKSVIYEDYLAAENQAKIVAEHITIQLKDNYPDLNVLKDELEHPSNYPSPEYFDIFKSSIRDIYLFGIENDDNDIFICDRKSILITLSLNEIRSNQKFPCYWNDFFNRQTNPLLASRAVELIFQQSNNLIFWEQPHDKNNTIVIPNSATIEDLHSLYQLYGIEAFKHVQFLAPAYITAAGDIFGINM